ncbi:MAG: hypothetical protein NTY45_13275 [Elusimicrobia bacterium]|nr:hypothetical protein [Elusimicrobiota bacterium]
MGTPFSDMLTRLREEAGFSTAYRFYHDNGGRAMLGMSYRNYLLVEQGKILPIAGRLQNFLVALRLRSKTGLANELAVAWLKALGGGEFFHEVLAPFVSAGPGAAEVSPVHKALERSLAANKYYMNPVQMRAMLASFETYKCSLVLNNDTGLWSAEQLAVMVKIKKSAARKALKEFAGVKLLKEVKKGFYKSQVAGRMMEYPDLGANAPELRGVLRGYMEKLVAAGSVEYGGKIVVRADAAVLRDSFPVMDTNLSSAQTFAVSQRTAHSALFYVVGRVVRLFDL